jgi:hypothetical protein
MEDFTTIQLKLPKDFNYDLDVYIAKLKRDGLMKEEKTKAQIIINLAMLGFKVEKKEIQITKR